MTRLTIDTQIREKLTAPGEIVELVDEAGIVVGTFRPALSPPYDSALIPPMDSVERKRRMEEEGGYTTAEVIRHLEGL